VSDQAKVEKSKKNQKVDLKLIFSLIQSLKLCPATHPAVAQTTSGRADQVSTV
jgi:hypothetical protein